MAGIEEAEETRPTVYVETTIVSYVAGRLSRIPSVRTHQEATREWWNTGRAQYQVYISQAVIDEAEEGDLTAAQHRLQLLAELEVLAPKAEAEALAERLRQLLHLPERASLDATHLAYAIRYEIDYLLTWNCAHLANARIARLLANLSREEGFWLPIICTPLELLGWEEELPT